MISQNGRQVAAIGLFALDGNAKLTRAGNSGFTADKPAEPILDFTQNGVIQGQMKSPMRWGFFGIRPDAIAPIITPSNSGVSRLAIENTLPQRSCAR